ncbi:type 2 lanthipeptide synthetase LanM family protein [Actinosynnema sp. CS-041913]|uniref:type 2 lanthipeptide synthetase LanM family protein n=1 Tax=Actinosynnema sp. CS-041913 TaxID=3239917 RepID=UPI003D908B85
MRRANEPGNRADLPPHWWAAGLVLRERLPAAHHPPTPLARDRVHAWRTAHGLDAAGRTAHRLAALGTDEQGLLSLHAEPPAALAARSSRPAWATFFEQALAEAPHTADHSDSSAQAPAAVGENDIDTTDWRAAFAAPFRPFVRLACRMAADRLRGRLPPGAVAPHVLTDTITRQLDARLVDLSARTLVLLVNRDRLAGTLTGATPADRFADFIRAMCTAERLGELAVEFPVLARLAAQACLQAVDGCCELLLRFAADRAGIAAELCAGEQATLVRVEGQAGDRHQGGRSVAVLWFADHRRVVYKPRPVALHARFTELARWLTERVPELRLRTAGVVVRPSHGWLEFVEHRACADVAEVNLFYRRQGALLALLYAIDGTDVHCENLISCGDQAVLIDLETMLHPTLATIADPAARALSRSVQRTSLLPQMFLGEHGALDISGLGGDRGAPYPVDAVRWASPATDEMRLVRLPAEFPGSLNRPRLADREIDPGDHKAALLAGFRTGYEAIMTGRHELAGLLDACADHPVRVLVRPTRLYATLLDESTHPSLLRDALDRDRAFDLLWADTPADSPAAGLVGAEIADLWAGDIPLLSTTPAERDLWTSDGRRVENVLPTPGLVSVRTKIAAMDAADRRDQEWLISATLATRSADVVHRSTDTVATSATTLERERLVAAACGIADRIVADALRAGDRANWLGVELVEDRHWQVLPMGAGLGEGYSGVALFLAELARVTGIARYRDVALAAIRRVPDLLDGLRANPDLPAAAGVGAHLGLGGLCHALARLGPLLDEPAIAGWLADLLTIMPPVGPDTPRGFADGLAGGLVAMRSVHVQTGLEEARELARRYADTLEASRGPLNADPPAASGGPLRPGFAHGEAGIAWALTRHGGVKHPGNGPLPADPGWCSGGAGIALARAEVSGWTDELRDWVAGPADGSALRNMSLCHGEMGVLEVLSELAGHDGRIAAIRDRRAGQLVAALERSGPSCGIPDGVVVPNLLTGLSGIGYGLLRLGSAGEVPSTLLLDPGRPPGDLPAR